MLLISKSPIKPLNYFKLTSPTFVTQIRESPYVP